MVDRKRPPAPAPGGDCRMRVNRAIDHVLRHLREPLHLQDVARQAHLSPYHFHRVFRALTGETLNDFVKRLRLERALSLLAHHPRRTLTAIALDCGFASSSDFSRCFRQRYGVPPRAFDLAAHRARHREALQQTSLGGTRHWQLDRLPPGANPDGFVATVEQLPPMTVAYIRVADSYRDGSVPTAANRLIEWADARGLGDGQWLGYSWDDPELVALADCRYDVGLVVPDVKPSAEIGRCDFPAMRVARLAVRGGIDLEMRALDWLFGTWLPASGDVPADQPCFEAWVGRPFAHGLETFELDLWLPVERA